jgi:stage V sporulation protein S
MNRVVPAPLVQPSVRIGYSCDPKPATGIFRRLGGMLWESSNVASAREGACVDVLKVSGQSRPKAVAGALAAVLREHGSAEMQAVGAAAVNQAVKAIAIARGFVAPNGIDLVTVPAFHEVAIGGEERTAIKFLIGSR